MQSILQAPGLQFLLDVDRLPLAYLVLDVDMRVQVWNSTAERMFGYSRAEAVGKSVIDLIVTTPVSVPVQTVIARLRAGDMDAHIVNENRTRDGRPITCEWFNTPLRGADGSIIGIACLAQDVTARQLSPESLQSYMKQSHASSLKPHEMLTPREREVLQLSAEGLTSGAIAKRLHISHRTVENHRANLMRKLRLQNLAELIRYAVRHKLIPIEN
ncbi:MAG: helix-turn-helix transcriptional regulator [Gemmataceae bacterium]